MSSVTFYTTGQKQLRRAPSIAGLAPPGTSFADLFRPEHGVWWLHCEQPTPGDVRALARAMSLHELTAEDAVAGDGPDKFEQFPHYFVVVYGLGDATQLVVVTTAYGVLTLHNGSEISDGSGGSGSNGLDTAALRTRLEALSAGFEPAVVTPTWVTYTFLDTVTDSFLPRVERVEKEASFVERELFLHNGQSDVHELLGRMCAARDASVGLMRLFQGKPAVLKGLLQRHTIDDSGALASSRLLLSAHGHLTEMMESTYALEAMLARSFNNYISIMRVKMVHSNSTMEQIAGAVALIGLVLLPSHLVTGAWATNVPVPGKDKHGQGWFWGVVSVMTATVAGFAVIGLWYYRRAVNHTTVTLMRTNPDYQGPA